MKEKADRNWNTASSGLRNNRDHGRARQVGRLLRNCPVGCGRADRIAVRRAHADCRGAAGRGCRGRGRVWEPYDRSFRRRLVFVGASARSLAKHYDCRSSLGTFGFVGVAYTVIVVRRMRKQAAYKPIFEDWLFHVALPLAAYAILALSSLFASPYHARVDLFRVG